MALSEIIKDKEDLIKTVLSLIEGKQAKTNIKLDGVTFHVGKSAVKMNGSVEIVFTPVEKKK